jgi:hypothetical protein
MTVEEMCAIERRSQVTSTAEVHRDVIALLTLVDQLQREASEWRTNAALRVITGSGLYD